MVASKTFNIAGLKSSYHTERDTACVFAAIVKPRLSACHT